jgi:hypothetical protein
MEPRLANAEETRDAGNNAPEDEPPKTQHLGFMQAAFDDWLRFLSGPDSPPFEPNTSFPGEWNRVFRLLIVTIFLSGIAIGAPTAIEAKDLVRGFDVLVLESKPALLLLIAAACLSVMYTFFFGALFFIPKLRCVPVTLRQAFFTVLLMGLPWLPPTALMRGLVHLDIGSPLKNILTIILVAWYYIALLGFVSNFYRGISTIHPQCKWWRKTLSLLIPISITLIIYLAITI